MSYVFYIKKEPDKGAFFPRSPRSPERLDHHFARCQKPSESMELNSSKLNFPIPFTSQLAQPSFSLMIIFSDYNLNWIKIALLSFGQKWSCFLDFSCATFSLWSKRHYRGTWFVSHAWRKLSELASRVSSVFTAHEIPGLYPGLIYLLSVL